MQNFARLSALLRTQAGDGGAGLPQLGDVGSAGVNSGNTMDPGAIGDSYTTQTGSFDGPIKVIVPSRPIEIRGNGVP